MRERIHLDALVTHRFFQIICLTLNAFVVVGKVFGKILVNAEAVFGFFVAKLVVHMIANVQTVLSLVVDLRHFLEHLLTQRTDLLAEFVLAPRFGLLSRIFHTVI